MTIFEASDKDLFLESHQEEPSLKVVLAQFQHILKRHAFFSIGFLLLGGLELVTLLLFFTFFVKSALLAISLGIISFTFFAYFILKMYFQAKKREQFTNLKDQYVKTIQSHLYHSKDSPEQSIAIAEACTTLAKRLAGGEFVLYSPPNYLWIGKQYLQKWSKFFHWEDLHLMQETLLLCAIEQHIALVKSEPTHLKAHAALANAFVTLSGIYTNPKSDDDSIEGRIFFRKTLLETLEQKFRKAAQRAIEEFKILLSFAPNDPWIHIQLAYSYRDLNMPLDEIKEYEAILKIDPTNVEFHYKLGYLYFQQSMNAQGLRIYEQLKKLDSRKAESLINHYGSWIW